MANIFGPPLTPSSEGISSGLFVNDSPGISGIGTRQSLIPNERPALSRRKLIHWLIPEGPIVEMYINPQNINLNHKKAISSQRVKGGFVLQYWGPELPVLDISGTTGTSGIEGINVLFDIYQNEQLAFDPYALYLQAKLDQEREANQTPTDLATSVTEAIGSLLGGAESFITPAVSQPPSLATLAFSVEMYYDGQSFRGYFTDFKVIETANSPGFFDYSMTFVITQTRGMRLNSFAWQKSAVNGPSNSGIGGPPHSFSSLVR